MDYADIKSITVLGDSVSRGVVYDEEKQRYAFSGEGFIKKLSPRLRPEIYDFSKYGATTEYGKKILGEKLEGIPYGIVLIEYGSNDCDFKWDEVAKDPQKEHFPNLSLEKYVANIREMVERVRACGKLPVLTNLHPLDGEGYFRWFTGNDPEKQSATLIWLKDTKNIYWWQEMYSYAAEKAAGEMGVFVVNIRNAFLKQKDHRRFLCGDGIHPNGEGHALIEQAFMEAAGRRAPELLKAGG